MQEPPYRIKNFVIGTIILWYGSIGSIPSGWHLCNGDMGTPDLIDRFIIGAGSSYAVGDTGGVTTHSHYPAADNEVSSGADYRLYPPWNYNIPPYHSLCYIMKVN